MNLCNVNNLNLRATFVIGVVSIDLFCVRFARFRTVEYNTTDHQTTSTTHPPISLISSAQTTIFYYSNTKFLRISHSHFLHMVP